MVDRRQPRRRRGGPGHGLIGIRERVAVVGGDVDAGPVESGGYRVRARLPYALEEIVTEPMIRVLLADDQPLVRAGLRMILSTEPDIEVVGEAGDGRAAVEQCERLAPDVVLMDVRMPEVDGIEATRAVTALPDPPGSSC